VFYKRDFVPLYALEDEDNEDSGYLLLALVFRDV
jgi:hypothetical protein